MRQQKALLIQDISLWLSYVKPALEGLLPFYAAYGVCEESVLTWIIREEIENAYHLFSTHHTHNQFPHIRIRDELSQETQLPLTQLTRMYVIAPDIYGDNNLVNIWIQGTDLYIAYHQFNSYIPKHIWTQTF